MQVSLINETINVPFTFEANRTNPLQCITINLSPYFLQNKYDPSLNIYYFFTPKSYNKYIYVPEEDFKKYNIKYYITNNVHNLQFFKPGQDFTLIDLSSRYSVFNNSNQNNNENSSTYVIGIIKNPEIRNVMSQQYILKSVYRYVIVDNVRKNIVAICPSYEDAKKFVKNTSNNKIVQAKAKPKIHIRGIYNTKQNTLLIAFSRYQYDTSSCVYHKLNNQIEFRRLCSTDYVEFKIE